MLQRVVVAGTRARWRPSWSDGIAVQVHGNPRGSRAPSWGSKGIGRVPAVVVTEDTQPRAGCRDKEVIQWTCTVQIQVNQSKEERLVADERAPEADGALLRVRPVGLEGVTRISIVLPGVGIQRRVPETPYGASGEPVGSRTRRVLNWAVAAPQFHVHRRQDHADFTDQVRVDRGDGVNPVRTAVVVHVNAVADNHHVVCPDSGKSGVLAAEGVGGGRRIRRHDIFDAGHHRDEIQNVVSDIRQVLHRLLAQGLANAGALCRQDRIGRDADLNLRVHTGNGQLKVVPMRRILAEAHVRESFRLEPRQRCTDGVSPGKQISIVVDTRFIRQRCRDNAGVHICGRDRDTRNQRAGTVSGSSRYSRVKSLAERRNR